LGGAAVIDDDEQTQLSRIVRRSDLVRVAQLVLVLEVVDSARARQVGGNVDVLATPVMPAAARPLSREKKIIKFE